MSTRGHHGLLMGRVSDVVSRLDFTVMPNGTVATDDTGKSWTFNSGGGSVSISSGALVTSGGGHLLTPSTSEWNFGADEFCIEAIVEFTARAERPVLGKWYSYGPTSWLCGLGTSGDKQSFYINAAPGGETYSATTPVSLGTTYHMACVSQRREQLLFGSRWGCYFSAHKRHRVLKLHRRDNRRDPGCRRRARDEAIPASCAPRAWHSVSGNQFHSAVVNLRIGGFPYAPSRRSPIAQASPRRDPAHAHPAPADGPGSAPGLATAGRPGSQPSRP